MPLIINTNMGSINAQNNLSASQTALQTSLQRLSSGMRINSAKDDAAGMAIASRMTSQVNGLTQAARNANDGISMAQTASGALNQVSDNLQRMRDLSVQAANGSNSASDRTAIQSEITQLQSEINRVASSTSFNGTNLLDGTLSNAQFQVGANSGQVINASIGSASALSLGNYTLPAATTANSQGIIANAVAGTATAAFAANNVGAGSLTIQGNGATSGAITIGAGETADNIASGVNAATGSTNVTAKATTTAVLDFTNVTAGTMSLTLNSGSTSAASTTATNSTVTVSATLNGSNDLSGLTAAINAQSGTTGISAIADLNKKTITLSNATGQDIGVGNNSTQATLTVSGVPTTSGGTGVAVTLAAAGSTGDTANVGGIVSFNSPSAFTTTQSATTVGITAGTGNTSTLTGNSVANVNVTTMTNGLPTGANNAIQIIDSALSSVNNSRAALGAMQNRFTSVVANLQTSTQNLTASRSRIQDTDFASETANLTRGQILQQAGTAMLAQANSLPNGVMALLR